MKSNNVIKKKSNEENDYNFKKLKLKFLEKDDLKFFSSLCQDGIFSINEMTANGFSFIDARSFSYATNYAASELLLTVRIYEPFRRWR